MWLYYIFISDMKIIHIKKTIALVLVLLFITGLHAQDKKNEKEVPRSRIVLGGGLGLQFGNITLIDISPIVGYKVTERFLVGLGFTYQYYRHKYQDPFLDINYETNIYGGSVFARYYVWKDLFGQAEYQYLTYKPYLMDNRVDVNSYLVGGGYRQRLSRNFAATIILLFDLSESMYSIYQNPIFRIGFQAGI